MNPYLTNIARFTASTTANTTIVAKTGEITGFNPQTWSVDVIFYPLSSDEGYDAGAVEVPLQSSWVGNGWGLYCAPALGTEVTVLFENGNLQLPIGLGFIFSGETQPLQGIQSEECWLVHKSGSFIKLTNDGKIAINANTEIDITSEQLSITTTQDVKLIAGANVDITASSGAITLESPIINLKGNVVIDGTLTANNGAISMNNGEITTNANIITTQDVQASGISLKNHTHGGVTFGGSNTEPPNP